MASEPTITAKPESGGANLADSNLVGPDFIPSGLAALGGELTQSAHDAESPDMGLPGLRGKAQPRAKASSKSVSSKNVQLQDLLSRRWARWLVPSFTDFLFVAVIVWLFMLAGAHGWQSLLVDGDVGWHIRVGEYMLDHHAVPHHDLYSFSKPGAPWFAWEWLADIIDAGLHRMAGLKGIVLAAAVIIALFAASLLRRMTLAGSHPFATLIVGLFGLGAASIHFLARPHIYTLLLVSSTMAMIEADRRSESARVWWLVPITLVWTNLHGGFLIVILALGLAAVGAAVEALLARKSAPLIDVDRFAVNRAGANANLANTNLAGVNQADGKQAGVNLFGANLSPAIRYALLAAACGAVTFVNPYGWGLHAHILQYLRSDWIKNTVQEFQSPQFRGESMLQFEALLFIGLVSAGVLARRRKIVEALWILAFAYLALSGARHIPIFVAVVSPLLAVEVTSWWRSLTDGAGKKSVLGILDRMGLDLAPGFRRSSLVPLAFVIALATTPQAIPWPKDFPSEMFPTAMVHAHERQIRDSRLMTTDQWADYLIYLHPEQKVFADGRSDFYGPEIGNQFLHLVNGAPDWEQLLRKYDFNLALLPSDVPLAQLLTRQAGWHVVANDGKRILLARHARAKS